MLIELLRYQQIKDVMQATRGKDSKLRSTDYFLASGASGLFHAVLQHNKTKHLHAQASSQPW